MTEHLRHRCDHRVQRVNLVETWLLFALGLAVVAGIVVEDLSKVFGVRL